MQCTLRAGMCLWHQWEKASRNFKTRPFPHKRWKQTGLFLVNSQNEIILDALNCFFITNQEGTMVVTHKYPGTNEVLYDILKSEQSVMKRCQLRKESTTNDAKQAPRHRSGAHINQRPVVRRACL